jgi:hypothetical protein
MHESLIKRWREFRERRRQNSELMAELSSDRGLRTCEVCAFVELMTGATLEAIEILLQVDGVGYAAFTHLTGARSEPISCREARRTRIHVDGSGASHADGDPTNVVIPEKFLSGITTVLPAYRQCEDRRQWVNFAAAKQCERLVTGLVDYEVVLVEHFYDFFNALTLNWKSLEFIHFEAGSAGSGLTMAVTDDWNHRYDIKFNYDSDGGKGARYELVLFDIQEDVIHAREKFFSSLSERQRDLFACCEDDNPIFSAVALSRKYADQV